MKTNIFSANCLLKLRILTLAVALCGFGAGCAETRTSDSTGQYVDDSAITAKIKTALLGDDLVKSFEIKVETVKGVVQLSGFVDNANQKSAAERDAASVQGVKSVDNSLVVR
jgi:hyperosmotically inducible protein